MPLRSWRREWKRGTFRPLASTLTCAPSIRARGVESWISSLRATPANPSAWRAPARAKTTRATFGPTSCGWFAKWDRALSAWRTSAATFPWGSLKYLGTWPTQGSALNGACFRRKKWARPTAVNGSSYLPTPAAQTYGTNKGGAAGRVGKERPSLETMARRKGGQLCPQFVEVLMGLPIGWTALEPLATPSCPPKPPTHSGS